MGFNSGERFELSEKNKDDLSKKKEITIINAEPALYQTCFKLLKTEILCMECFGRQFSYLGTNTNNTQRAESLLLSLTMECHQLLKLKTLDTKYNIFHSDPLDVIKLIVVSTNYAPAAALLKQLSELNPQNHIINDEKEISQITICNFCGNLLKSENINGICKNITDQAESYDFSNFLVGTFLNPNLTNKEEEFRARNNIQSGESFKANLNRLVGKHLQEFWNKKPEYHNPDLQIMIDLKKEGSINAEFRTLPVYIKGNYLKFSRNLPQTHWNCSKCNGKGILRYNREPCDNCNGTGEIYSSSVHDLLQEMILPLLGGEDSIFHGAGRENASTQCLGRGRPFILEIKNPKKRTISLIDITKKINQESAFQIFIRDLVFVEKKEVHQVKSQVTIGFIEYDALVYLDIPLSKELFRDKCKTIIPAITQTKLIQRTPLRLISKKDDKTNEHQILSIAMKLIDPAHILLKIKCDRKLYLSEFIDGDHYRTSPALASLFEIPMKLVELSVSFKNRSDF